MSINKGTSVVKSVYAGSISVKEVYKGSTLVYQDIEKFEPFTLYTSTSWVVPRGIYKIKVTCVGARGFEATYGGKGGVVQCNLSTTPGQTLYVVVGTVPTTRNTPVYNASDIRTNSSDLWSRLIVAGGGGSCGANTGQEGGAVFYGGTGGTLTGGNGSTGAGAIGYGGVTSYSDTASWGHGGSSSTAAGTFGLGGASNSADNAGAGGAGWYGGGGGTLIYYGGKHGGYYRGASGGGGSSYTHPTLCTNASHNPFVNSGNGYVTISMA